MTPDAVPAQLGADAESGASTLITLIRPPRRWPGLDLGELWRYRAICLVLARRNLMVRYRQTLVGAAWALLQPVSLMLVFTVFFGALARVPSEGIPYPVFFLSGLVVWQMVSKILNEGSTSVVANATLVGRVYFPRAYFPISVAIASLADLLFGLVALAAVLIFYGIAPTSLLLIPPLLAIAWLAALGVSLSLSAINTTYRDVTQLLPFLAQLWMFISPVIYPSTLVPEPIRWLYFLNPVALSIEGFRHAVAGTPAPDAAAWLVSTLSTAFLLIVGYLVFRHREPTFADVV
ncbi:MAG TPA: ABC transporter permease [Candidatus Limnocylindrales bacterium]|nr:ABC transporter permease [Candidatus Limnocylindrales bacterium]